MRLKIVLEIENLLNSDFVALNMELENAKLCAQIIIPWISTNSHKLYQFNDFVQD